MNPFRDISGFLRHFKVRDPSPCFFDIIWLYLFPNHWHSSCSCKKFLKQFCGRKWAPNLTQLTHVILLRLEIVKRGKLI